MSRITVNANFAERPSDITQKGASHPDEFVGGLQRNHHHNTALPIFSLLLAIFFF